MQTIQFFLPQWGQFAAQLPAGNSIELIGIQLLIAVVHQIHEVNGEHKEIVLALSKSQGTQFEMGVNRYVVESSHVIARVERYLRT